MNTLELIRGAALHGGVIPNERADEVRGFLDNIERNNTVECEVKTLHKHNVSQRSELLAFKDWFNNLPDESDDRLYITDKTIDRFKANCG